MIDRQPTYRFQRVTADSRCERSIMFSDSVELVLSHSHGVLTTELVTLGSEGPTLGRVLSTGHAIALREAETLTVLLPREGRLDIRIAGTEYAVPAGTAMAFRPTERHTVARPGTPHVPKTPAGPGSDPRFAAATLQVPIARLHDLARAAETTADTVLRRDGMDLAGEPGQLLGRTLPRLIDDLLRPPAGSVPPRVAEEIGALVDEQLCGLIGAMAARTASRRIFPAYHRVRQAEEIMHAESDNPVSMLAIAATLGVSLRSLQLAFAEVHDGVSPREHLIRIRLDKARRRLLDCARDDNVTSVAMESGFYHLSRFAQAYARTFGEKPSETLARRRR
ncbi:AraC family transcriptional regulator [Roseivivax isoporae]|uniref:HTH araC/xylS-type domain-containing protein n=1 Tax=Roseivivax isoporae LMG 25204 TaxID=1449351 RepID=X7F970_9RHOB|nr:helix-turn-helix domain-containing protein [Roseivivax isoporae]ETX28641.1 hypothetical protein RISW2_05975 [Roseivivax isoporae LMG 25204]